MGQISLGLTTYLWSGFKISYFELFTETQLKCFSLWIVLLFLSYNYTSLTFFFFSIVSVLLYSFQQPSSSLAFFIYSLVISGGLWLLSWLVAWRSNVITVNWVFSWEWGVGCGESGIGTGSLLQEIFSATLIPKAIPSIYVSTFSGDLSFPTGLELTGRKLHLQLVSWWYQCGLWVLEGYQG